MKPVLRVIEGQRATPCERPSHACDETHVELVVAQAERATFLSDVRKHTTFALAALYQTQPDIERAERVLAGLLNRAVVEHRRLARTEDDGPPALSLVA